MVSQHKFTRRSRIKMNGTNCFPTCSSTSPDLQSRRAKQVIRKNITYTKAVKLADILDESDSDPEQTQRILDVLISRNTTPPLPTSSPNTTISRHGAPKSKQSVGGWSTGDSGMHSRDSLLDADAMTDGSTGARSPTSLDDSRSSLLSTSPVLTRHSRSTVARGEFDAVVRATLLDSRLRSKSRSRLESRGKSPCRSSGVRSIISYFEDGGSLQKDNVSRSRPEIRQVPVTVSNLRQTSSQSSKLRADHGSNSTRSSSHTLNSPSSPTVVIDSPSYFPSSTPVKPRQNGTNHLTRVASGYTSHTAYSTNKSTNQTAHSHTSTNGASTHPLQPNGHKMRDMSGGEPVSASEQDVAIRLSSNGDSTAATPHNDEADHSASDTHQINSGARDSPSEKGGEWFLQVVDQAESRLLGLSDETQNDVDSNPGISDEVTGQMRASIGKATLLVNKKFKQFRDLCNKNLTQSVDEQFPTTSTDLAGFWDMVEIQVDGVVESFAEIARLRKNGWQPLQNTSEQKENEVTTPRSKQTNNSVLVNGDSLESTPLSNNNAALNKSKRKTPVKSPATKSPIKTPTAQRDEARRRIMAAKRAMRERRNSESEDVIYVTEH